MSQGPVWDFLILHRRLIQVIFNSNSCYCSYGYIVTCFRWHKHFYNVCVADEGVGFNAMSFIGSVTGLNILLTDFLSPKLSFVSLWYFSSYLLSVFGFEELYIITHCIQLVLFFFSLPLFFQLCNIPSLPLVSVPFQGSTFILGDALFMPLGGNTLTLFIHAHSLRHVAVCLLHQSSTTLIFSHPHISTFCYISF